MKQLAIYHASTHKFSGTFIAHGSKICLEVTGRKCHCKQLCGGMEISGTLDFWFQFCEKNKVRLIHGRLR